MSDENVALKPIDTPIYRYYQALYMCFYNNRLYVDVAKRWKGFCIVYLLLTLLIAAVPFALRTGFEFNRTFNDQILDPLNQLPVFYIQNGMVSFDKPMPYMIKDKEGKVVLILDTTGVVNSITPEYPKLSILINKDKITLKMPSPDYFGMIQDDRSTGMPYVQTFNKDANLVFDGKRIIHDSSIEMIKYTSQFLVYPLLVGIFFPFYLILFAILGFLGQLFSSVVFSFSITFMQSMRLMVVAGTPIVFIFLLAFALHAVFSGLGFILLAILAGYYSFAVLAFRAEARQLVRQ